MAGLASSNMNNWQLAGKPGNISLLQRLTSELSPPTCKGVSCGKSRVRLQVVMEQCKLADASALLVPSQQLCSQTQLHEQLCLLLYCPERLPTTSQPVHSYVASGKARWKVGTYF